MIQLSEQEQKLNGALRNLFIDTGEQFATNGSRRGGGFDEVTSGSHFQHKLFFQYWRVGRILVSLYTFLKIKEEDFLTSVRCLGPFMV